MFPDLVTDRYELSWDIICLISGILKLVEIFSVLLISLPLFFISHQPIPDLMVFKKGEDYVCIVQTNSAVPISSFSTNRRLVFVSGIIM